MLCISYDGIFACQIQHSSRCSNSTPTAKADCLAYSTAHCNVGIERQIIKHITAQHGTAHHSTARHSIAQHSTAENKAYLCRSCQAVCSWCCATEGLCRGHKSGSSQGRHPAHPVMQIGLLCPAKMLHWKAVPSTRFLAYPECLALGILAATFKLCWTNNLS